VTQSEYHLVLVCSFGFCPRLGPNLGPSHKSFCAQRGTHWACAKGLNGLARRASRSEPDWVAHGGVARRLDLLIRIGRPGNTPHVVLERVVICSAMMKRATLAIADIYVPVKRRATLDQKRVDEIAANILDKGLETPILVRADGARFVLVEGLSPFGGCHKHSAKKRSSDSWSRRGSTSA
jgi:sulfiredoxin